MRNLFKFRRIEKFGGGFSARVETVILLICGIILRPVNFRGIGSLSRILTRLTFSAENYVVLSIHNQSKIKVFLGDYYWSRLLFSDFFYESDVSCILEKFVGSEVAFLDCGANIGYWSMFASERIPEPRRVIAVEPSVRTFGRLLENLELNGHRFTCVRAALESESGRDVDFLTERGHAGARIKTDDYEIGEQNVHIEQVKTVTIDDLCQKNFSIDFSGPLIIKLDVEGAEVAALKGAKATLRERQVLLLYEDHGSDLSCRTSQFVFDELGFEIYFVDDGNIRTIVSIEEVRAVKRTPNIGYNFFACFPNSSFSKNLSQMCT